MLVHLGSLRSCEIILYRVLSISLYNLSFCDWNFRSTLPSIRNAFAIFYQTFLGQKYGFRPLPSEIPAAEFEKLLSNLTDQDEKAVLGKWFKCDLNAIPPTYVLQPVSFHIPDHLCRDAKQRKFALQQWSQVFAQIQNLLRREAIKEFKDEGEEQLHKYFMSGDTPCIWDKSAVGYIYTARVPICSYVQDWALVLFNKHFILGRVIRHFHFTSYLAELCVLVTFY